MSKKKKKASKKSVPRAARKTAKKTTKKSAKKTAIKAPAKKTAKKTVKKATQKPAKKVAAKKATAKAVTTTPTEHRLIGQSLPNVTLENQNGEQITLASVATSTPKVVLYFYPKDDTPGCTVEACDFRDNLNRLQSAGIKVYGISPDDKKSHQKFREKHGLNFDLLVDEGHKLADTLNVWKLKKFMGREYMGIERSTFLVKDGKIARGWQPVKVDGHVDEILKAAEDL